MTAKDTQVGGDHYRQMKIQPIDFIVQNSIPFREANAIKYIVRHASKNGRQDIEKAIHYLQMILESEYPKRRSDGGPIPDGAVYLVAERPACARCDGYGGCVCDSSAA